MEENVSLQIFGRAIPFTKETQKSTAAALVAKVTDGEARPHLNVHHYQSNE